LFRYAYACADPVNNVDPTGAVTEACGAAVLDAALGVTSLVSGVVTLGTALPTGGLSLVAGGIAAVEIIGGAYETTRGITSAVQSC
jgi:hypothetical protein